MECAEAGFSSGGARGISSLRGDGYSRFSASVRVWILSPAPSSCAHVPYVQLAGGLSMPPFFHVYYLPLPLPSELDADGSSVVTLVLDSILPTDS